MISSFVVSTNIISSLGFDTATNVAQISKGVSGIQKYDKPELSTTPFHSSLIDNEKLDQHFEKIGTCEKYTRLEKMLILSLCDVIQSTNVSLAEETVLIISTTKGNIDALSTQAKFPKERAYLANLGKEVQDFFGFTNEAIVVSNACVSGILSVAMAKRLIGTGMYKHVLIASGDMVSPFVLSGFNSFKAISSEVCQPFSKNRKGITIGEAAASALVTCDRDLLTPESVQVIGAGICNDANHISGPSRTGEGLYQSIQSALKESNFRPNQIDYISAHGTATNYNDEMEAIAMNRVGLQDVPLNSLKGYYGHTLGASGLLETIIGIHSLHNNTLYASAGFDELGVSQSINVIKKTQAKELNTFLKTASGFGGCNTAVIFTKVESDHKKADTAKLNIPLKLNGICEISKNKITINGEQLIHQEAEDLVFSDFAKKVYKANELNYRKFFKMDNLSKLAFLAAEFLFRESETLKKANPDRIALLLSNRAASLDTDRKHQSSIEDKENYFPSPTVFVYTLANICVGEISIRHQLKSENVFCIFNQFTPNFLEQYSQSLIQHQKATTVICGWVDFDGTDYHALLYTLSADADKNHHDFENHADLKLNRSTKRTNDTIYKSLTG